MPDEKVKRQIREARKRAAKILESSHYSIVYPSGFAFDIIGMRKREQRFVRIVIGKPDEHDVRVMQEVDTAHPLICAKEIWAWMDGCFDIQDVE